MFMRPEGSTGTETTATLPAMVQPPDPTRHSRLLCALAEEARARPLDRKLLVCRRYGEGLELLRALAAAGVPWVGFEPTTPKRLALDLVPPSITSRLTLLDDFDEQALIDLAIDEVLQHPTASSWQASLSEGVGLRRALSHSVQALRLGGITAEAVRSHVDDPARAELLAGVLEAYDRRRAAADALDAAELFRSVLHALEETGRLPQARVLIVPGQNQRGISGALLRRLVQLGAVVLPDDTVAGLEVPRSRLDAADGAPLTPLSWLHAPAEAPAAADDLHVFTATSIESELREVLRRIIGSGAHWDEAEIAATDPATYAVALDSLARRLDIPVGYAQGLPVSRTLPGRVLAAYVRWVEEDFREDVIRGLIERSEIRPPGEDVPAGPTLARRLRRLRIGRGRDRYLETIRSALRSLAQPPDEEDERSPEELEELREQERRQLLALESVLRPVLEAFPDPADVALAQRRISPAGLARGARALLELSRAEHEVDRAARDRMLERLRRIETTLTRETTLRAALATLVEKLDDRVPAPETGGRAPWVSSGGRLHFTDIDGTGRSGRRLTFIVGLDAGRFPGVASTDALLGDGDRRRLSRGEEIPALPTTADRIEERRYAFAAALARLRGTVTLSYAAWNAAEGRSVAPSAELLQAYRLMTGDATADYDAMQKALAPHASAVPRGAQLDASDTWLAALDRDGILRRGAAAVAEAYPALSRGMRADVRRALDEPNPFHGVLEPRPSFDPRSRDAAVSASQLQTLGSCPHRYLLRYVLGVRAPDDPEATPGRWLDARQRGSALHEVFERTLREARAAGVPADPRAPSEADGGRLREMAVGVLHDVLARLREEQPPPGPAVFDAERRALEADVRAFVSMVLDDQREWLALEAAFGDDEPVRIDLPGGALRIRGKIDRIDRLPDGSLAVVDYKTGKTFPFRRETGVYFGGRRLQHAFYAAGAESLHEGRVARVEYHFPGVRGENERAVYARDDIAGSARLIEHLLMLARRGWFVPTENSDEDCRFCDFANVCRVRAGGERVASPPAEWSRRVLDGDAEALRALRTLREWG